MKNIRMCTAALALFLLPGKNLCAQSDFMGLADQISIQSINAIRILESANALEIVLTLINDDAKGIKVERGRFQVIINPDQRPPVNLGSFPDDVDRTGRKDAPDDSDKTILPYTRLDLGMTDPMDFEIPGCLESDEDGCRKPGKALTRAVIRLPRLRSMRDHVIFKLINYLGLPGSQKKTALIGKVRAGIEKEEGWSFFPADIKLELYYGPKIQSQSLFVGW